MGAAMTRGLLGPGSDGGPDTYLGNNFSLVVTAKHAIGYGESVNDGYTTDVSDRKLYDVFLRPWREFALAGGRGFMVAHESLNFVPMHANTAMLRGELRGRLNMTHALIGSDNENVRWLSDSFRWSPNSSAAAVAAITAGVDQEMDLPQNSLYLKYLAPAVESGALPQAVLDSAVANVLRAKFAAGLFDSPYVDEQLQPVMVHTAEHVTLARQAAADGIVLLGNAGGVLPLPNFPSSYPRIAVIGPNGGGCSPDPRAPCEARGNQVGNYAPPSSSVPVYTLEDAVREAIAADNSSTTLTYVRGADINGNGETNKTQLAAAVTVAEAGADLVLLVLGDSACVNGFGGVSLFCLHFLSHF